MTDDIDLYLHETWEIDGTANDAAGQPIPLTDLQFTVISPTGAVLSLDKSSGVTLASSTGGYKIAISDEKKASFDPSVPYRYFTRAIGTDGGKSIQNEGRF